MFLDIHYIHILGKTAGAWGRAAFRDQAGCGVWVRRDGFETGAAIGRGMDDDFDTSDRCQAKTV